MKATWRHEVAAHVVAAWTATVFLEGLGRILSRKAEAGLHGRAVLTLIAGQWLQQVAAACLCLAAAQIARTFPKARVPILATFFGVLLALAIFPVAGFLAAGEWISQHKHAWVVQWLAPSGATLVGTLGLTFLFSSFLRHHHVLRRVTGAILMALAFAFCWAHARLFPGLYKPAHLLLMALSAFSAQWALADIATHTLEKRMTMGLALRLSLMGGALTLSAAWLVRAPVAVVAELLFKSPRAGTWITYVAPAYRAHPIRQALANLEPAQAPVAAHSSTDGTWRLPPDWNVILLVVDTLRADPFVHGAREHPKERFKRSHAPFLNELFDRSFTFRAAYAGGNMTHISMPSMLRSRNAFDTATRAGTSMATRMARTGRHTIAVTPSGLAGRHLSWTVPSLLEGFAEVHSFSRRAHDDIRPLVTQALDSGRGRPFFAWIHYMSMHSPGWAGKSLARSQASHTRKYRKSLVWTDGEIKGVFRELAERGLAEKTVVIITADHGEGLGDSGLDFHAGPALPEEVIRVPLAIYIPGHRGRVVEASVGNIDIMPTLVDLLGGVPSSSMSGTSLVPQLEGVDRRESSYYIQSFGAQRVAAVRGTRKYVFDVSSGVWAHYDLASDPWGSRPLFDPAKAEHQAMADELTRLNPSLFADDLSDATTDAWLDRRLNEVVPREASARVAFLLDLIRLDPTPARLAWARRVFEEAKSDTLRLQVLERTYAADPASFGPVLEAYVKRLHDPEHESSFIAQLSEIHQQRFAPAWVAGRLGQVATEDTGTWKRWLDLIEGWPLSPDFSAPLTQMISSWVARPDADTQIIESLLKAVSHLERNAQVSPELRSLCASMVGHHKTAVRVTAALAVGRLAGPDAENLLRSRLSSDRTEVRIACLRGLIELNGARAIPDIVRFEHATGSTLHAIHLIEQVGGLQGLPFLEAVIDKHQGFVAQEASNLRDRLQAR